MLQEPGAEEIKHAIGDCRQSKPELENKTFTSGNDSPAPYIDKDSVPDDNGKSIFMGPDLLSQSSQKRANLSLRGNKLINHTTVTHITIIMRCTAPGNQKVIMLVL